MAFSDFVCVNSRCDFRIRAGILNPIPHPSVVARFSVGALTSKDSWNVKDFAHLRD